MRRRLVKISSMAMFYMFPVAIIAQSLGPPDPPGGVSLYEFIQIFLGVITKLAIPVLAVLIVYFGFKIVASTGDEKGLAETKHRLIQIVGVAAVFLALAAIATIIYNTGKSVGYPVLFPPN